VDTKQLACLVAVIDRASFSQAAEQLGVTQPAVSLAIRSLERRLGATLIDRSGRQVEATEPGRVVYRHAQRILALEDELTRSLADSAPALGGMLQIGASTGPGERVLPGSSAASTASTRTCSCRCASTTPTPSSTASSTGSSSWASSVRSGRTGAWCSSRSCATR
jgi:DNA-binding transcriptional LysR family regulator